MPVNLLTKRLKDAKRELTNLKTAHMRGLGYLKVYSQNLTITDGPSTGIHSFQIDITLSNEFAAYPFTQLFPAANSNDDHSIEVEGFTYSDGYHVRYRLLYAWGDASMDFVRIVSTSPITNVTYTWID